MKQCANHPSREAIYDQEQWCLECFQDYWLDEDWKKKDASVAQLSEQAALNREVIG